MVLSPMAQTSFTKSLRRSQSMNLTAPVRPGSPHLGAVCTSSSWTTFTGHQHGTAHKSGRPLTYKLTKGSSFRSAQPANQTLQRHSAKPNTSARKQDSIQRLTNGGICYAPSGLENKRLSCDTTICDSLPGNRSEDGVEPPKSILKHVSRRDSAPYGEIARCASLNRGSFPTSEVTSPNSQTRGNNAPNSLTRKSIAANSQMPRTNSTLLAYDANKHRDEPADVSGEEAALRKCNYRLGLCLTSYSDPKRVTFDEDILVISM